MEHPATHSSGTTSSPHGQREQSPDFAEALAKGYEPKDIGLRPVFMFIAGLSVVMVVVLLAIYAIMMAMAAYDRTDTVTSPVAVKIPAPYAPLQPSLGIYGNHDNDHDLLDWQDMDALRYKADAALHAPKGTTAVGRTHEPIEIAMDEVLPKLVTKPVAEPGTEIVSYPPGSYEGVYNLNRPVKPKADLNPNDLQRLNNQGN